MTRTVVKKVKVPAKYLKLIHSWGGKTIDTNSKFPKGIGGCKKYGLVICEVTNLRELMMKKKMKNEEGKIFVVLKVMAVSKDKSKPTIPVAIKVALDDDDENGTEALMLPLEEGKSSVSFSIFLIKKHKYQALPAGVSFDTLDFYFVAELVDENWNILETLEDRQVFQMKSSSKKRVEEEGDSSPSPAPKRQKRAPKKAASTEVQELKAEIKQLKQTIATLQQQLAGVISPPPPPPPPSFPLPPPPSSPLPPPSPMVYTPELVSSPEQLSPEQISSPEQVSSPEQISSSDEQVYSPQIYSTHNGEMYSSQEQFYPCPNQILSPDHFLSSPTLSSPTTSFISPYLPPAVIPQQQDVREISFGQVTHELLDLYTTSYLDLMNVNFNASS